MRQNNVRRLADSSNNAAIHLRPPPIASSLTPGDDEGQSRRTTLIAPPDRMKIRQLRNGTPVWMPSKVGLLPATVTAHDESESLAAEAAVPYVTVEVILEHQR
jgi:hypothetical protein